MLVPYFGDDYTPDLIRGGVTPLMRCQAVNDLHDARNLLEKAGRALRSLFDKHHEGCPCPLCRECPHVWVALDVTVDSIFDHLHMLDQFAPPTAKGMEEILEDARNGAFDEESRQAALDADRVPVPHVVGRGKAGVA